MKTSHAWLLSGLMETLFDPIRKVTQRITASLDALNELAESGDSIGLGQPKSERVGCNSSTPLGP